jgi:DNA adenine methylase
LIYETQQKVENPAPFLRWAGSKRQLIPILNQYWSRHDFESYIEVFAGAAHFFFSVDPNNAVLNDINSDLINTYEMVKIFPDEIYEGLSSMPIEKSFYYHLRSLDINNLSKIQQAVRIIYLNRYCFNGLYRTDKKGNFNVPFSPTKVGALPSLERWRAISNKLQNTDFLCQDFEDVILRNAKEGAFFYLDPPYYVESKSFTEYSSSNFTKSDIDRLIPLLDYIHSCGGYFVLSYLNYPPFKERIAKWNVEPVSLKRKISCKPQNRQVVTEILVSNIY